MRRRSTWSSSAWRNGNVTPASSFAQPPTPTETWFDSKMEWGKHLFPKVLSPPASVLSTMDRVCVCEHDYLVKSAVSLWSVERVMRTILACNACHVITWPGCHLAVRGWDNRLTEIKEVNAVNYHDDDDNNNCINEMTNLVTAATHSWVW